MLAHGVCNTLIFTLWKSATAKACGESPLTIPPLELSELFAGWQNGGVEQSDKYKAVTATSCDRFCDCEPLQVPPAAESNCKFRL